MTVRSWIRKLFARTPRTVRKAAARCRLTLEVLEDRVVPASFASAVNHAVGDGPFSVAVGDFNGDGQADLAVANETSNNVSVLLGNGSGAFASATGSPFAVGAIPNSVAVGDFNGDGKQDLAVANFGSHNVSVLLGDGTGAFGAATNFATGTSSRWVAVGDFDNDGKSDLAVTNSNDNNVSVLLGTGTGSFSPAAGSPFAVGIVPISVAVGDFNGDGNADLATANLFGGVSVLLGNGAGSFAAATTFAAGNNPFAVAVGDFDGDGRQDLAVANQGSANVSVLLGDGAGSFSPAAGSPFAVGFGPRSVAVGDFNGDGKQDLATANNGSASVLLGNGAGSFTPAIGSPFAVGIDPVSVAVGDFNGDGQADLAVANDGSDNVSVLLNQIASLWKSVEMALPAPFPVFTADGNANFVGDLYRTVLGRLPDAAGLAFWDGQLDSAAMTRAAVVDAIFRSPEHYRRQVQSFYARFLGRTGEAAGVEHWVNALLNGASERDVILGFLLSAEYQQANASDAVFVAGLYQNVLGRIGEAAGTTDWAALLGNGASRFGVCLGFLASPELAQGSVAGFYRGYLGRNPSQAELDAAVADALNNGEAVVACGLLSSNEFFDKFR